MVLNLVAKSLRKQWNFILKFLIAKIADPQWDYWAVTIEESVNSGINGGIEKGPNDYPHGTRVKIEVDSIDEAVSNAKNNGAMVVRQKMEFDDFYLAYLVDPVGQGFGLIQEKIILRWF